MLNLLKYSLFIIFCVLLSADSAISFCSTQTACKISDLENQHNQEIEQAIINYFEKKVNFSLFTKTDYKNMNYNDLFIYNTIV